VHSKVFPLPKLWNSALALDLKDMSGRVFEAKPGFLFYGHGLVSPDGKLLYCAEAPDFKPGDSRDYQVGLVTVRDTTTLEVVDEFPTYGNDPHDMALVDDGKTIAVVNGGNGTCVSFVDRASQKLLEKYETTLPDLSFRHMAFNGLGDFAVNPLTINEAVQPYPLVGKRGSDLRQTSGKIPAEKLQEQALSIAMHDHHFCTTCYYGNSFTLWKLDSAKEIATIDFPGATGVCLTPDRNFYMVNSFSGNQVALIDTKTLEVHFNHPATRNTQRLSGRHLQWLDTSPLGVDESKSGPEGNPA
jgi:hypothetical protein